MSRRGPFSRRRWPRSLRRKLALQVCAIVSVAMIGIGIVAEMGLRNEMIGFTNSQVANSLGAFSYSYAKARANVGTPQAPVAAVLDFSNFPGQAPGTVIALIRDGRAVFAAVFSDGEPVTAAPQVIRDLESVSWISGDPRTVKLGELGPHQVGSRDLGGGERLVSAVSLREASATLARNALIVAVLVLVALVATAAATVFLVTRALRPLRRVAAIAGRVAKLPPDAEEFRITARVSDRDTDPQSEVGMVGAALNRMLDNVDTALTQRAESDRRVRQFITDASHELRTPLAAIRGYAELTRQESDLLPPMTEYALERIESESQRMSALVADLLLLSRLDEGQDLQIEHLDLCELLTDAVNDARVSAPDHQFVITLPTHPVWADGDRAKLQQLLTNLLRNAGIHTPEGVTVTSAVAIGTRGGLPVAEITVSDNGPGIPQEIMPNLFGRFVRADKGRSREMGCSGLGLAIVASIAEAHNGTVSVTSKPGRTTFTVVLPATAS